MDLFECQDFFKAQNPGKKIAFEFDENCHRVCEFIMTEGLPNITHHVECNRVKVSIEDNPFPVYVPISPHRLNVLWSDLKDLIMKKSDVHFNEPDLENLDILAKEDKEGYEYKISEFEKASTLSRQEIEKKISEYVKKRASS